MTIFLQNDLLNPKVHVLRLNDESDFAKWSTEDLEKQAELVRRAELKSRLTTTLPILLPPFLLLLLGLAGVWVMRGFRRSGIQGGSP